MPKSVHNLSYEAKDQNFNPPEQLMDIKKKNRFKNSGI